MRHFDNCEARGRVSLRAMAPGDLPVLAGLWVATWVDTSWIDTSRAETGPAIDFPARRPWIEAFLADPANTTLVALAADDTVGFASFAGPTLHQLAVAPHAKGGGAARALLEAVKASSTGRLALEVNQGNARAVRFYRREGFAITGEGRNPASGLATWSMAWRADRPPR